jgi:diguanylate cyclase (GGDEF)-like protein
MTDRGVHARPPVVLIVDDQEWSTRSLDSVLAPNGYAVVRAYTAAKGLERAQAQAPDLVFISNDLPDCTGAQLCHSFRDSAQLPHSVPLIIVSPERPTREQRINALEAGAWEFLSYPVDARELVLRLDCYIRAKFEADRARDQCLLDERTGLYNLRGLEQRARELRSMAYRTHEPLACVVMAPVISVARGQLTTDEQSALAVAERLGVALKKAGRISDAIGRLGLSEYAILAPSTDAEKVVKLVERIEEAVRSSTEVDSREPIELRVGYDAVADVRATPLEASDLLIHATLALRKAKENGNGGHIQAFEEWGSSKPQDLDDGSPKP